ncbi:MAG: hypothetical protein JRH20_03410 [Deltaproteobacteria bacterium]|nr:hypothetical protein [Deltaproteobacteria bacterium]
MQQRIQLYFKGDLDLKVTDNRSVIITVKRDPKHKQYHVRLHHLFVDAPAEIVRALALYIAVNEAQASRLLNHYIDANENQIRGVRPHRPIKISTTGRAHDLAEIFHKLNQRYFGDRLRSRITWGRNAGRGQSRRSVRLGSFTLEENLIRIHPGLDQGWIPAAYLEWIVYHEMLHAVHPMHVVNGRRRFHTRAFAEAEQRFELHAEVHAWEQRNLPALLRI